MKELERAVVAHLQAQTGVETVAEGSACQRYPLLVVTARQSGTLLIAGGRQSERRFSVTVQSVSDRKREGATALLDLVLSALTGGIPYHEGGIARVLHPLDAATEGDCLHFSLVFCVAEPPEAGTVATEWMERLTIERLAHAR